MYYRAIKTIDAEKKKGRIVNKITLILRVKSMFTRSFTYIILRIQLNLGGGVERCFMQKRYY
jgi:hypothetical protein